MSRTDTEPTMHADASEPSRRNPFAPFEDEILRLVIAPKIAALVDGSCHEVVDPEWIPPESKADLHRRFMARHASTVSASTFSAWLDALGIIIRPSVTIHFPPALQPWAGVRNTPTSRGSHEPLAGVQSGERGQTGGGFSEHSGPILMGFEDDGQARAPLTRAGGPNPNVLPGGMEMPGDPMPDEFSTA